jgi:hypothetical protein
VAWRFPAESRQVEVGTRRKTVGATGGVVCGASLRREASAPPARYPRGGAFVGIALMRQRGRRLAACRAVGTRLARGMVAGTPTWTLRCAPEAAANPRGASKPRTTLRSAGRGGGAVAAIRLRLSPLVAAGAKRRRPQERGRRRPGGGGRAPNPPCEFVQLAPATASHHQTRSCPAPVTSSSGLITEHH